jgi:WD40 repeat protein
MHVRWSAHTRALPRNVEGNCFHPKTFSEANVDLVELSSPPQMTTFTRPRNETNLDTFEALTIPVTSPPHLVAVAPGGGVLVAATPHGATFFWPSNCRDMAAVPPGSVHSVAFPDRIVAMTFLPRRTLESPADAGVDVTLCSGDTYSVRFYMATSTYLCAWDISTLPSTSPRSDQDLGPRTVVFEVATVDNAVRIGDTMTVTKDGTLLALGIDNGDILVLKTEKNHQPICRLEGHTLCVNALSFFYPHEPHVLITVSDDRTFKVWDCDEHRMLYQSMVVSSSPFLSVAVDPIVPAFVVGAQDGSLRMYKYIEQVVPTATLAKGPLASRLPPMAVTCVEVHHENVGRLLDRRDALRAAKAIDAGHGRGEGRLCPVVPVVSTLPVWARMEKEQQDGGSNLEDYGTVPSTNVAPSRAIIMLAFRSPELYGKRPKHPRFSGHGEVSSESEGETSDENSSLNVSDPSFLIIGTSKALLHVNSNTYEVDSVLEFDNADVPNQSGPSVSTLSPLAARAIRPGTAMHPIHHGMPSLHLSTACMFESDEDMYLSVFVGNKFKSSCTLLHLPRTKTLRLHGKPRQRRVNIAGETPSLSFACLTSSIAPTVVQAPAVTSIFPAHSLPSASPLNACYMEANTKEATKSGIGRWKSGRGTENKPVTFHTRIRSSGYGAPPAFTKLFGGGKRKPRTGRRKQLDLAALREQVQYPASQKLSFGKACPQKDTLANGPITGMSFTRDAKAFAISCADGTATSSRLPVVKDKKRARYMGHEGPIHSIDWNHGQQMQLLLTASEDGSARVWLRNKPASVLRLLPACHGRAVKSAKFFYVDKFVVLAIGNRLELHKYAVDHLADEKNDLRRLQNKSKHRLVKAWEQPSQTINSIACLNSIYSPTVLTSGSNRNVHVYNLGLGIESRSIEQAHGRAIHSVVLPGISEYTSLPDNVYDVFLTGSTDGSVKLWDLRSSSCARKMAEHTNRVATVGMAFSPCMRYVAVGSEDKTCVIYDIRNGNVIDKLRGHTDTITTIAYNPKFPQLVTGAADGRVLFYNL